MTYCHAEAIGDYEGYSGGDDNNHDRGSGSDAVHVSDEGGEGADGMKHVGTFS